MLTKLPPPLKKASTVESSRITRMSLNTYTLMIRPMNTDSGLIMQNNYPAPKPIPSGNTTPSRKACWKISYGLITSGINNT
jgi:hypothetical protein